MTATDELRAMLDERGVEWWEEDGHTLWYGQSIHHAASAFSSFMFGENDKVHLNAMVAPKQAVEATLGRGTCKYEYRADDDRMHCSECGQRLVFKLDFMHYCPNCGRRVES